MKDCEARRDCSVKRFTTQLGLGLGLNVFKRFFIFFHKKRVLTVFILGFNVFYIYGNHCSIKSTAISC